MRVSVLARAVSWFLTVIVATAAAPGFAQPSESPPTSGSASHENGPAGDAEFDDAEFDDEEKQQAVTAAVYLAAGVALVGILLIVLVLVWGVRVRRLARTRPISQAPPDPLWYLRTRSHGKVHEPPKDNGSPQ